MPIQLSLRLQAVASYIPPQMHVADIGGDHAFLLLSLAERGLLHKGIVGEKNFGPFQIAEKNVRQSGFTSMVEVRLGEGLNVLKKEEVDVVVIAGMGGALIRTILDEGKDMLQGVKRLILQPNNVSYYVRQWLYLHQYQIVDENIVEDNDILYEVIVAEPGIVNYQYSPNKNLFYFGPLLWENKHPLLTRKLQEELYKKKRTIKQLQNSTREESNKKRNDLEEEAKIWEKAIKNLSEEMT